MAQLLACEGSGDVLAALLRYEQATGFYEHALQTADKLMNYLKTDPFGEVKHIKARIQAKLASLRRRWDMDRYGEGYVLYREAEVLRRQKSDFLSAYLAYQALAAKFPQTVYAEAGKAYCVKCLLALSEAANARKASARIAQAETDLKKQKAAFAPARAHLAKKEELKDLEAELAAAEARLARMKAVPLGDKALAEAEKAAKEFLAASEFGLYRGEVLCDLAAHHLRARLDLKAAGVYLSNALSWLNAVERVDLALAAYQVPDQAKAVSAPPREEKRFDEWGNVRANDLVMGAIVNRLTCEWYLAKLRREAQLAQGFVQFMAGARLEAKEAFAAILATDPTVADYERRGWPNAYRRLQEDCDRGYFWGWPEDLEIFVGQKRVAVFLAGFLFEVNEHIRSRGLYERLLAGEFGALLPAERMFALQGKGECHYAEGDLAKARACFAEVAKCDTVTAAKGLLSLANVCLQSADKKSALAYFVELHRRFPKSRWGEKGLYYAAFLQAAEGEAGRKAAEEFLRQYPRSEYAPLLQRYLAQNPRLSSLSKGDGP